MTPRHSPSTYAAAPAPFARHGRYILQNRPRTRRRWAAIQSPGRPARPATKPRPAVSSLAPPHQPGQAASARSGSCPCSQRHRGRAGTMLNVRRAGRASVAAQRPAAAAPLHCTGARAFADTQRRGTHLHQLALIHELAAHELCHNLALALGHALWCVWTRSAALQRRRHREDAARGPAAAQPHAAAAAPLRIAP